MHANKNAKITIFELTYFACSHVCEFKPKLMKFSPPPFQKYFLNSKGIHKKSSRAIRASAVN